MSFSSSHYCFFIQVPKMKDHVMLKLLVSSYERMQLYLIDEITSNDIEMFKTLINNGTLGEHKVFNCCLGC